MPPVDEEDLQSCFSFAVSFTAALEQLDDGGRATILKAIADETPGLKTILVRDQRNRTIVELAKSYSGTLSAKAKAIAADQARYYSGLWPRHRDIGLREGASERSRLLYRLAVMDEAPGWRTILVILEKHGGP